MSASVAAVGIPTASAAGAVHRADLRGSMSSAVARSKPAGKIAASSRVKFDLTLQVRHAAAERALARAVSSPGNKQYHHYITDAQWLSRFGPTTAAVSRAESWLRKQGFTVGKVANTRLFIPASGTAKQVEKAFATGLGLYKVQGHKVRLATKTLSIPTSLSGTVAGVVGVNQYRNTPDLSRVSKATAHGNAKSSDSEPAPPTGFRNPKPCSAYWGQQTDTADSSSLYAPYTGHAYDICGYSPYQLRGGYGIQKDLKNGIDGSGVTIAIVDAYDSPTLLADAQHYYSLNDAAHQIKSSQFTNIEPASVGNEDECAASGWYDEQSLDVESSHAMAPGANIEYVGADDCFDSSLLAALTTAITSGASVVSDSWGDTLGDLLEDADAKTAFDNAFVMAEATGVSVLFSSGDDGDNFADFGLNVPDYPPTSPYVTAVGGTSLEVGANDSRMAEYGWSTAKQTLCVSSTTNCGSATSPAGALAFQAGGGGGTSYYYTQPYYQAGVVPAALALRNENIFGPQPLRVEPDISMDGDAQTGMLIGLTQTFGDGVHYGQFKEGGTSLASPLLAGVIADTDQASGVSEGFMNPTLYKAYGETESAFNDIVPPANADAASVIRVDYANTMNSEDGYVVSLRVLDYEGSETYCDATGNCATRPVTLSTAPGFDSLTGLGTAGPSFVQEISKF
ncbi:MAG TPA: S53 family peptidase [Mycobacteriales bacterium]|nr:S53 family peptidase [Mycobacteriales bacterium]